MLELTKDKLLSLSEDFGNAFYLLESRQFQNNYTRLSNEFKKIYSNFNIAYSYKTNYTPKLCRIVNDNGGYAEVVSDMEAEIALRVGVQPTRIIWNGPIKNTSVVNRLLLSGATVNIDSIYEIDNICSLADAHPDTTLNVGIRCNFDVGDGVISRFGVDSESEDFEKLLEIINRYKNIRLINIQCHFAKRQVEYWPARAEGMSRTAVRVKDKLGYLPQRVDIGGGIFGNMADELKAQFSSPIPDYSEYALAAATVFKKYFPDEEPELLIEPGSALAGDCMRFVGRVEGIKTVRAKTFITMLGSQKNISMSGVNPPMKIIHCGEELLTVTDADIVGYTCIEGDVLYHGFNGEIAVGDYIVFSNCGSYSLVMKPPFILPNFPVIDICGEEAEVIKRQEYFEDIFSTFSF